MDIYEKQIDKFLAIKEKLKTVEELQIYDKDSSLEQLNQLLESCPNLKKIKAG